MLEILLLGGTFTALLLYGIILKWISIHQKEVWEKKIKPHVANSVTGIRILLFWLYMWRMFHNAGGNEFWHAAFFIAGGIVYATDFLDGYLARKLKTTSEFGADFDPLGDKLVAFNMLFILLFLGYFPALIFFAILVRDAIVTSIRWLSKKFGVEFSTSAMGKARANIIGFGGAFIYASHYWSSGIAWMILGVLAGLLLLNFVFAHNRFLMKKYNLLEKFIVLTSFIIAAIQPQTSVAYAMLWITVWTLIDYAFSFYRGARGSKIANETPFIKWYLGMFKARLQVKTSKKIRRKEKKIAKLQKKATKLQKQIDYLRDGDVEIKKRRWPKMLAWLIISGCISVILGALMTLWGHFKWFGNYGLVAAIAITSGYFLVNLIIKVLTKRPK